MGAITIWSTTTLFARAEKLVELCPRGRRGNLNSRYLFQRPMTGPEAKPVTSLVFSPKTLALTHACSKVKKPKCARNIIVKFPSASIFFRYNLRRDVWWVIRIMYCETHDLL